ncbi:YfhD family protein [Paenibacillus soyae]|uniref:YfhD family protein n=1 Tax=Paenibacillus soyae TaxID=2969249 RepID=A0A9X2S965_9BACL|nr:YfhD family protein [Paenibacillus soyae]MCR2803198.1 YfhD family protein [Paenibacillus soyae]
MDNSMEKVNFGDLPADDQDGKVEDVEFSEELADEADRVAMKRAAEADSRNEQS